VTLRRDGEEDVILVTGLLDAAAYPAEDLLALYLARWGIERVFQQITEVSHPGFLSSLSRPFGRSLSSRCFRPHSL
jgi:hypothetical protein